MRVARKDNMTMLDWNPKQRMMGLVVWAACFAVRIRLEGEGPR
jgi:hypothetical protein